MQYFIHPDDESGGLATEASADQEYARNVGYDDQDRAWILSDRDCWYANPFYHGPKVPHLEDDSEYEWQEDMIADQDAIESAGPVFNRCRDYTNDEIPY